MIGREKVIKGLRCIKGDTILCRECDYADVDGHGNYSCKINCAIDALALLKEQEAVEPRVSSAEQRCGNCNKVIEMDGWIACPWCGKRIDWESWWSKNGNR